MDSERSSSECQHPNKQYTGAVYDGPAGRKTFLYYTCPDCKAKLKVEEPERLSLTAVCACSHVNNWHVRADHDDTHCAASDCPCGAFRASSEPEEPRCGGCGHEPHIRRCIKVTRPDADVTAHCGCALLAPLPEPEEPPLTPEEEEEVSGDELVTTDEYGHRSDCSGCSGPNCGPPQGAEEPWPCGDCGATVPAGEGWCVEPDCREKAQATLAAEAPPQPERRPPYAIAYSVSGHLFEVALSGDVTALAVDGALVLTHALGPIAGIVQIRPHGEATDATH